MCHSSPYQLFRHILTHTQKNKNLESTWQFAWLHPSVLTHVFLYHTVSILAPGGAHVYQAFLLVSQLSDYWLAKAVQTQSLLTNCRLCSHTHRLDMSKGAITFYSPCLLRPNPSYLPATVREKNLFKQFSALMIN